MKRPFSILLDPDAPLPEVHDAEGDSDIAPGNVIAGAHITAGDMLAATSDGRVVPADKRSRVVGVALDSAGPGAPLMMSTSASPGYNEQVIEYAGITREVIVRSTTEAIDLKLGRDVIALVQQHFASGGPPVLRIVPARSLPKCEHGLLRSRCVICSRQGGF